MQHFTARLTANAEVNTIKDGRQVVNFNVAKNSYYKTKSGEARKTTEYYQCAYWIGTGIAPLLTKGTQVELFGRISARAYLDKNGDPKAALQMHTSAIEILSGRKNDDTPQTDQGGASAAKDDLPF